MAGFALRPRIAKVLGWSQQDVDGFSLPALRDLVRPVDQKLAEEITRAIQTGSYIIGDPV